jgi:uncharacterized protein (UPF0276 family)
MGVLAQRLRRSRLLAVTGRNNIYVSSINHQFDALEYLHHIPANRIQQIHLAGHSDHGDYIVDTHDAAVAEPVWQLYEAACKHAGAIATMIERDDDIPALPILLAEVARARELAARVETKTAEPLCS